VAQATNTRAPACTRAASYRVCGPLGGVGYLDERFVEYDLDSEDERWLGALNGGQDRLPPRRLESLIWRLELANAEATDRALAGAGEQAIKYEFRKINHVAMRFAWSTSLVARRAVSAHTHSLTCRLPPGGRCRGCPASWSAPPTRGQAAARLGVTEITQCWTIPMQDSEYVQTSLAAEGLRCSAQRCMSGMGLTRPVSRGAGRAGATQAERMSPAAVAATEHLSREEAYAALAAGQPLRPPVRGGAWHGWLRARRAGYQIAVRA